mmetsp:Transcript_23170/g.36242  ORF Transcript_23170/g.36242 Transcript_23170/m.36242 type:complete len:299 (-) Transcript_23170:108-1004(-)
MAMMQDFQMQEKLHDTLMMIDREKQERVDLMARMEKLLGMESLPRQTFEMLTSSQPPQNQQVQPEAAPIPAQAAPEMPDVPQATWEGREITAERMVYSDTADGEDLVPREMPLIQNRPALPPSLSPDGYEQGDTPQMPGHPDIPIEILPFLMLGTNQTASDESLLTALGVTALLSTSTVDHEVPQDVLQYLQCSFNDLNTSLSLQRQKAMDTISSTRQMAGRVLVFDNEDLNCCVCMMYLMWECRLTLLQSFALVQYKLPTLRVSRRLCKYLVHYEAILHGANSMQLTPDGLLMEATI